MFDFLQQLITADETDRLQAPRAERSDFEQLRVSPRKGSTLLARMAKAGRVNHTVLRLLNLTQMTYVWRRSQLRKSIFTTFLSCVAYNMTDNIICLNPQLS